METKPYHDVLFSNFSYDPDVYYFLYCGDIKAFYLNNFVQRVLEKKKRRKVAFIAIVPDVFTQYDYQNVIVINPAVSKPGISCRADGKEFMTAVSNSKTIHRLIQTILSNQDNLYIYLFESMEEMRLDEIEGVSILGPDKRLAKQWNNKVYQYEQLHGLVPMADYCFCSDVNTLLQDTAKNCTRWSDGIFVSCAYSAAGSHSLVSTEQDQILLWSKGKKGTFLVSRFIPHVLDPTVLAVVANEEDVYVAGIADQVIVNGNRFIGSTYPSTASSSQKSLLKEYTITIGRTLGKQGYRGIFGCDFIITADGAIYFIEVNARKQGTTLEFCYTLEQSLPEGASMLPELEYYAVIENRFPTSCDASCSAKEEVCWGTYNFKVLEEKVTIGYVPHNPYEQVSFNKIGKGFLHEDYMVLEHVGAGLTVLPGTFLARVVSVANSREKMQAGLQLGVGAIRQTLYEV